MKFKKSLVCILLFCICLTFSGCAKMYDLTEEEEEKIVLYSAKMVAKFNRASREGYAYVDPEKIEKAEEEKRAEEEEEAAKKAAEEAAAMQSISSFSDIIGVDGMNFSYVSYEVTPTVATPDVAVADATAGNTYIVLHFTATNISSSDVPVDLLNNVIKYKLSINDNVTAENYSTLSVVDLSTYYSDAVAAGSAEDLVLIFETNSGYVEDIQNMVLQVTKGNQVYSVKIQ
ncbi:MAG: hypothetical protein K6B67_03115 [Lachnospiraceae bacterium]|nr:hypothetical protein [Lachnospiraceae bacterium]